MKIFSNLKDKAIVFDRDGTLIHHEHYLYDYKKVKVFKDVSHVLKSLKKRGALIFMHTNQSIVSRGIAGIDEVKKCNTELIRQINLGSDIFEDICIATDIISNENNYRKPSTRFGKEILNNYNIDKKNLYYIGDNFCDLETAHNLRCQGIGLNTGTGNLSNINKDSDLSRFPICASLTEALSFIK